MWRETRREETAARRRVPCESKKVPGDPLFCDVSLPVPLDQAFTYRMPETLRHRVQAGCRVLAPLGTRTLTGLVLRTHTDPPQGQAREILRLLDEEPALDDELLQLGKWIAEFYCAPLGETLRAMTPLAGEIRRGKVYSLTKTGRDVARQLHLGSDDTTIPRRRRCACWTRARYRRPTSSRKFRTRRQS